MLKKINDLKKNTSQFLTKNDSENLSGILYDELKKQLEEGKKEDEIFDLLLGNNDRKR